MTVSAQAEMRPRPTEELASSMTRLFIGGDGKRLRGVNPAPWPTPPTLGNAGEQILRAANPDELGQIIDIALSDETVRKALAGRQWDFAVRFLVLSNEESERAVWRRVLGEGAYLLLVEQQLLIKLVVEGAAQLVALYGPTQNAGASADPVGVLESQQLPLEIYKVLVRFFHAKVAGLLLLSQFAKKESLHPWMASALGGLIVEGYRATLGFFRAWPGLHFGPEAAAIAEPFDLLAVHARHTQTQEAWSFLDTAYQKQPGRPWFPFSAKPDRTDPDDDE